MAAETSYNWDFFLAHAGADKADAEFLYDMLSPQSRVFLDSRCLELGDTWDTELKTAQRASWTTVVLISTKTENAYYQREEIAAAIDLARKDKEKHRVVPIYLDSGLDSSDSIPYGLRRTHGLEISSTTTLPDCAKALLEMLEKLRGGPAATLHSDGSPLLARSSHDPSGILHQPPADWESPVLHNPWRYKLAAFDLDGTLLRGSKFSFSWERVWNGLGFGKGIQRKLKREYRQRNAENPSRANRIEAYQDWCQQACEYFKRRHLTRDQLRGFSDSLTLTANCREALTELRKEGVAIAIISGGIDTFLEDKFPDFRDYVDFVFINQLLFSSSGALEGVRATAYDFQGKAEALDVIGLRIGSGPDETVFIGDHFNDEAIMLRVHKAIAYPPQDEVTKGVAHVRITEDNLKAVLPHILVD